MSNEPQQHCPPLSLLNQRTEFDPAEPVETFLKRVPAKWVVYLMADSAGNPIQLLCVRNLRSSLKRRLSGDEPLGPTKSVKYREFVRQIHWRRVDSAFEADWYFYESARQFFPKTYRGMVGFRPAWFVHVNPQANFPRYVKTNDATLSNGTLYGPLDDKHAAARLIELIEDSFDLCRYYQVLVQSPNGTACAYKEMGKCPAPCDGSISMNQYRNLIELSMKTIVDPADAVREHTRRMQQAAGELRFETAAQIKKYVEQLSELGKGVFRFVAPLSEFVFLSIQRGPRANTAKVFLIVGGEICELICVLNESFRPAEVMSAALHAVQEHTVAMTETGAERLSLVSQHLFSPKQTQGVFIQLSKIDEKGLAKAFRDLQKQKVVEETEDEGIVKELQSINVGS